MAAHGLFRVPAVPRRPLPRDLDVRTTEGPVGLHDFARGQERRSNVERTAVSRIALLAALGAVVLPASGAQAAPRAGGPTGQFQPSATDRDGDGVRDASDCAPDDPTRPARTGPDANCDGTADGAQQAASAPAVRPLARDSARRAAGGPVRAVPAVRLGGAVAVFAPRHPRARAPELIFAARDNSAVTVRPVLVLAGGRRRVLTVRSRSVARGQAYAVTIRLSGAQARARRLRFAITVIDASGRVHHAVHAVRVG